jgi:hypothetical protein
MSFQVGDLHAEERLLRAVPEENSLGGFAALGGEFGHHMIDGHGRTECSANRVGKVGNTSQRYPAENVASIWATHPTGHPRLKARAFV